MQTVPEAFCDRLPSNLPGKWTQYRGFSVERNVLWRQYTGKQSQELPIIRGHQSRVFGSN